MEMGELFVSGLVEISQSCCDGGEIVVFEGPGNPGVKYIKRVVAVAVTA